MRITKENIMDMERELRLAELRELRGQEGTVDEAAVLEVIRDAYPDPETITEAIEGREAGDSIAEFIISEARDSLAGAETTEAGAREIVARLQTGVDDLQAVINALRGQ